MDRFARSSSDVACHFTVRTRLPIDYQFVFLKNHTFPIVVSNNVGNVYNTIRLYKCIMGKDENENETPQDRVLRLMLDERQIVRGQSGGRNCYLFRPVIII